MKGYKGRQIILLDSARLETPVLKKSMNEVEKIEEKEKTEENQGKKEENPNSNKENSKLEGINNKKKIILMKKQMKKKNLKEIKILKKILEIKL